MISKESYPMVDPQCLSCSNCQQRVTLLAILSSRLLGHSFLVSGLTPLATSPSATFPRFFQAPSGSLLQPPSFSIRNVLLPWLASLGLLTSNVVQVLDNSGTYFSSPALELTPDLKIYLLIPPLRLDVVLGCHNKIPQTRRLKQQK